jgi:hypothetical protein
LILYDSSEQVYEKMKKSFGLHCHMLTLNSRPQTTFENADSTTVIDSNMHQADGSIQAFWQDSLDRKYSIDTALQQYSQQLSSNSNSQGSLKPIHDNMPLSPGAPPLARSSSSSSIATNHSTESSTSASASVSSPIYPTGIATQAFDLISSSLDQPMSPATDSSTITNNNTLNNLESQAPSVQYGQYLTPDHIDKTKLMVKELVTQSLVPFMERNIQHWNEQVASARRGITGRLFGASRRLFGTNQSRNPSPQSIQTIPANGKNIPAGVNSLVM